MVSNEIFVGAGVTASLAPEARIFLGADVTTAATDTTNNSSTVTLDSYATGDIGIDLVPNLYVGCFIEIELAADPTKKNIYLIESNTVSTITVTGDIRGDMGATTVVKATIQSFGAPVPTPPVNSKTTILSDNWLGLVNTFTPPNVEVETGELNLVAGGSRNLGFQFTKGETVSGGSIEFSMNNPMWLYYTLGTLSYSMTSPLTADDAGIAIDTDFTHTGIMRRLTDSGAGHHVYPDPTPTGTAYSDDTHGLIHASNPFVYTITENNKGTLPSFALDVAYAKGGKSGADYSVQTVQASATPEEEVYSRIFTGCQVNSLNIQFDEGQEVKNSVELVTRSAFDAPQNYSPQRQVTDITSFANYSENKIPYLFHDGTIEIYGQTFARVKSGSLTINNNIVGQRFIGNYNNQIMSNHTAGQRQYELSLTLLITDTKVWDLMREGGEDNTNILKLRFERSATDFVDLQFKDYITRSVSVPYPDDKGPVEVELTISPRTLHSCTSQSRWAIFNVD